MGFLIMLTLFRDVFGELLGHPVLQKQVSLQLATCARENFFNRALLLSTEVNGC